LSVALSRHPEIIESEKVDMAVNDALSDGTYLFRTYNDSFPISTSIRESTIQLNLIHQHISGSGYEAGCDAALSFLLARYDRVLRQLEEIVMRDGDAATGSSEPIQRTYSD